MFWRRPDDTREDVTLTPQNKNHLTQHYSYIFLVGKKRLINFNWKVCLKFLYMNSCSHSQNVLPFFWNMEKLSISCRSSFVISLQSLLKAEIIWWCEWKFVISHQPSAIFQKLPVLSLMFGQEGFSLILSDLRSGNPKYSIQHRL